MSPSVTNYSLKITTTTNKFDAKVDSPSSALTVTSTQIATAINQALGTDLTAADIDILETIDVNDATPVAAGNSLLDRILDGIGYITDQTSDMVFTVEGREAVKAALEAWEADTTTTTTTTTATLQNLLEEGATTAADSKNVWQQGSGASSLPDDITTHENIAAFQKWLVEPTTVPIPEATSEKLTIVKFLEKANAGTLEATDITKLPDKVKDLFSQTYGNFKPDSMTNADKVTLLNALGEAGVFGVAGSSVFDDKEVAISGSSLAAFNTEFFKKDGDNQISFAELQRAVSCIYASFKLGKTVGGTADFGAHIEGYMSATKYDYVTISQNSASAAQNLAGRLDNNVTADNLKGLSEAFDGSAFPTGGDLELKLEGSTVKLKHNGTEILSFDKDSWENFKVMANDGDKALWLLNFLEYIVWDEERKEEATKKAEDAAEEGEKLQQQTALDEAVDELQGGEFINMDLNADSVNERCITLVGFNGDRIAYQNLIVTDDNNGNYKVRKLTDGSFVLAKLKQGKDDEYVDIPMEPNELTLTFKLGEASVEKTITIETGNGNGETGTESDAVDGTMDSGGADEIKAEPSPAAQTDTAAIVVASFEEELEKLDEIDVNEFLTGLLTTVSIDANYLKELATLTYTISPKLQFIVKEKGEKYQIKVGDAEAVDIEEDQAVELLKEIATKTKALELIRLNKDIKYPALLQNLLFADEIKITEKDKFEIKGKAIKIENNKVTVTKGKNESEDYYISADDIQTLQEAIFTQKAIMMIRNYSGDSLKKDFENASNDLSITPDVKVTKGKDNTFTLEIDSKTITITEDNKKLLLEAAEGQANNINFIKQLKNLIGNNKIPAVRGFLSTEENINPIKYLKVESSTCLEWSLKNAAITPEDVVDILLTDIAAAQNEGNVVQEAKLLGILKDVLALRPRKIWDGKDSDDGDTDNTSTIQEYLKDKKPSIFDTNFQMVGGEGSLRVVADTTYNEIFDYLSVNGS